MDLSVSVCGSYAHQFLFWDIYIHIFIYIFEMSKETNLVSLKYVIK